MPELPEVETTVRKLSPKIKRRRIADLWTDWPKYFRGRGERANRALIVGRSIKGVSRRGKNILIELSGDNLLVVHQKLSGHLLVGTWDRADNAKRVPPEWSGQKWIPRAPVSSPLWDTKNKFIRFILFLDNGRMLALSDLRRFAKILAGPQKEILASVDLAGIGPDALKLTKERFIKLFDGKRGVIKQVLMDQRFIAGIGNIYADESLYKAKIHPRSRAEELGEKELATLYRAIQSVLKRAIQQGGTSIDDYREPDGKKGRYGKKLMVYQRTGKPCPSGHEVKRIRISGRSTHFCPVEQKLYT